MKRIHWGRAVGGMLGAEIALIAAAFAWVTIYSYLIHPGESLEFYQQYALKASPWVSISLGIPIFYLASRWAGSRSPSDARPTILALFVIYVLVDLPLTLLGGGNPYVSPAFLAANYLVKFLACYGAARQTA